MVDDPFGWLRPLLDPEGSMPGDEFTARVLAALTGAAVAAVLVHRWALGEPADVPLIGGTLTRFGPVMGRILMLLYLLGAGAWARAAVLAGTDLARGLDPRARWRASGHAADNR
ncbi:hypothetical protein ACIOJE_35025 [Kitasatospora sp. NPDC087861]|uniref:hypothetical protein n=1 Tax=Kitasatospora sp. NPDC087861 TaxID=3364070 RepID=UPI003823E3BA